MTASIRQAITTKFYGPTNHRKSRIKATAYAKGKTIPYEHALNIERNHAAAAQMLADNLGWKGAWVQGGDPDGSGYVFVWVEGCPKGAAFVVA